MLEISIVLGLLIAAAWDTARRHVNDTKAAREFRNEASTRLLQELQDTTKSVQDFLDASKNRQQVQEQAMVNFITQAQKLIQFSEDRRKDASKANTRASL